MLNPLAETAPEEAEHGYAGLLAGFKIESVSVDPWDCAGRVRWAPRAATTDADMLVVVLAGESARRLALTRHALPGADSYTDRELARDLALSIAARTGGNATTILRTGRKRAAELARQHRSVVERLTRALLARNYMTGAEFASAVERAQREQIHALAPYGLRAGRTVQERAAIVLELETAQECAERARQLGARERKHRKATSSRKAAPRKIPANGMPGVGSSGAFVATESFTVTLDGRRETVTAGQTWLTEGHELLSRHPDKFKRGPAYVRPRRPARTRAVA